jgi:hypothetical protein
MDMLIADRELARKNGQSSAAIRVSGCGSSRR